MTTGPKPTLPGERRLETAHKVYLDRNEIIRQRYSIGGVENTCRALGKEFSLTPPRIHQIVKGRRVRRIP